MCGSWTEALAVWSMCDGYRTVDDIVDDLQVVLETNPDEVRQDVMDVLDLLSGEHGYVLMKYADAPSRHP